MLKDKIKKLIGLIEGTEIEEIEVSSFWGAQKIRLSKSKESKNILVPNQYSNIADSKNIIIESKEKDVPTVDVSANLNESSLDESSSENLEPEVDYSDESKFKIISAPLVGTFYSCPKPGEPPYIKVGDRVEEGMTVCIIEAMKIFNDIDSDFSGILVETYIDDGQPVEYGQELFVLKIENV